MKILFVEDDDAIALGLIYSLEKEGYQITHYKTQKEAINALSEQSFDLLLLDVGLPDGNGYEICRYAKSKQEVPVIFLTAMDDEVNIVMGLDIGGDDYITKPFRIKELQSRIRSVMRRYQKQEDDGIAKIRDIIINTKTGKVYKNNTEILLTALEYRLLLVFLNHQGQILSRSQILEGIWDVAGNYVNDNTLSVYIKRLREKLEDDPGDPLIIVTVRGLGYRMEKNNVA
ncbi:MULTISPECIES: response regulator transcription factor [Bacillota]|jgi:DNA-binding response OmpR family regulator|uniref:Response regulator transcription factor n=2 Tax=Amedibacillus TaxID=2749846 RepID=A0A7G9GLE0_9FIRM|nr:MULTISPECIES: response regulator transcription factor [Bacillota]QNM11622.1 response regulator transcription factor [[Eubacterium] hominis]MCH4285132.1 response regulator transcription factor [Amedibacillus hominis]RGB56160.1 DNA-binding response regulator [Absiella sp. AM22-9]RGB61921.1 DNA-binding response regulator [Absiella sp. AM10-20]RGB70257.1 DNA-binding response regulator [Absiella sp. AM09-45]